MILHGASAPAVRGLRSLALEEAVAEVEGPLQSGALLTAELLIAERSISLPARVVWCQQDAARDEYVVSLEFLGRAQEVALLSFFGR